MISSREYAISIDSIREAHERIRSLVHETPVLTCQHLNELTDKNLFFKCEFMQKTGSFKARGASNAILKNGYDSVCTHSSGNHGQALSWAAKQQGIAAYIVMPSDAPLCKRKAVEGYGGRITFCEPNQASREATASLIMREKGASFVPPYDHSDIMSGQGTMALEFLKQVPDLDIIIVPIGGGGMCSGVTMAAKALKPSIKIVAAEPEEANDAFTSKARGVKTGNKAPPKTIADGLKTNLGDLPWPIVRDLVDEIITVTEQEIKSSLRLIMERMKCIIEPSAAVGLAVALKQEFSKKYEEHRNVGIILCGGNIDVDCLTSILI